MFSEKVPFGVTSFTDHNIRADVKKVISAKHPEVTLDEQRKILSHIQTPMDSYKVIAALLTLADEMGSYSLPVYKALCIIIAGMRSNQHDFTIAAKAFLPEIRTMLYFSFGDQNAQYRDQVHYTVQTIYHHLCYKTPLPQNEFYKVPEHFIASAPRDLPTTTNTNSQAGPKLMARARSRSVKAKNTKALTDVSDEEDYELPFDIRAATSSKPRRSFNPFSSTDKLPTLKDFQPVNQIENEQHTSAIDLIDLSPIAPQPVVQNPSILSNAPPPSEMPTYQFPQTQAPQPSEIPPTRTMFREIPKPMMLPKPGMEAPKLGSISVAPDSPEISRRRSMPEKSPPTNNAPAQQVPMMQLPATTEAPMPIMKSPTAETLRIDPIPMPKRRPPPGPVPRPEGLDNPRGLIMVCEYQLIRKAIYDESIESL